MSELYTKADVERAVREAIGGGRWAESAVARILASLTPVRLPVLTSCGDCGRKTAMIGTYDERGRPQGLCVHDDVISGGPRWDASRDREVDLYDGSAPPDWCPWRNR